MTGGFADGVNQDRQANNLAVFLFIMILQVSLFCL